MATIRFHKFQGTGNDFVMVDNRNGSFGKIDVGKVKALCDRRFGIGADGVILLENSDDTDFEMIYYNPDGSQSLCGNGSRCAVMFAHQLRMIQNKAVFKAIDGSHEAKIEGGQVHLRMRDVLTHERIGEDFLFDTGSPHYIQYVESTDEVDPLQEGRKVRYSERFTSKGINVNFVEIVQDNELKIRTYERGVEGETFSCGTGCTAAALSLSLKTGVDEVWLRALGGTLKVAFTKEGNAFKDIFLIGPAKCVFSGQITIE